MCEQLEANADLLREVKAIADFLGQSYWQTYGLIRTEGLPTFSLKGKQCARRESLRTWLAEREAAGRHANASKKPTRG